MKKFGLNSADYIKGKFIDFLLSQDEDIIIGNEIMYGIERRVVDLLFLKRNRITAVEVKSDGDSFKRMHEQITEYKKIFNYVLILITEKHLGKIHKLPKDIGIYVIFFDFSIKRIRTPRLQTEREKIEILHSINSKYLKKISELKYRSLNADEIRIHYSKRSILYLQEVYYKYLRNRVKPNFDMFLTERGTVTHIEDLNLLSSSHYLIE